MTQKKHYTSSNFSKFIREAKSSEKKKVYGRVLQKATEQQKIILEKAASKK